MKFIFLCLLLLPCVLLAQVNPLDVTIARDAYGVPHIFGKKDTDVAYGLAWAHAEDDFEVIQSTLLAGKAMMGRYQGKKGATIDYLVQWLRARDRVNSQYQTEVSAEYRAILKAYAEGINAYAEAHPEEILVKRAFPVSEEDIMTGYQLSIALFSTLQGTLEQLNGNEMPLAEEVRGSNGFAFNANMTADGQVYLAINSHQPLSGPLAWYEAHLCSEEGWNILGGTFPGGTNIFHGANEHLGWAHTVNYPDKMDVFELTLHPRKKHWYRFDGEWRKMEVRRVPLRVKFGPFIIPLRRKALWSVYGPVWEAENGTFALRFPAMFNLRTPETWFRMNKATNFSEWKDALDDVGLTHFNIVYGDRYDTIYYVSNARLPQRNPAYDWSTTLPGDTSATLWPEEMLPFDELPQVLQPKAGYVYNTNHTPYLATDALENPDTALYNPTSGFGRKDNNRSTRFRELINQQDSITWEDFLRIKYDLQLPKGELHYPVDINFIFDLDPKGFPAIAAGITKLQQWNRRGDLDNEDAALFIETFWYLREAREEVSFRVEDHWKQAIETAQNRLMEHFGTLDVPLGDYQRLIRGDSSLPLAGIPDVLAAMYSEALPNGQRAGLAGESYILLVRFGPGGPQLESVNVYGASNRPDSPHYADQMPLFVKQRRKPMTLDKEEVLRTAKRIYHPGE